MPPVAETFCYEVDPYENLDDLADADMTLGSVTGMWPGTGLARAPPGHFFCPSFSFFIEEKDAWLLFVFRVLYPLTISALETPVCSVPVALVIRLSNYCFIKSSDSG